MEFVEPGPVTLLQFTPLCSDGYGPQNYGRYIDAFSSTAPGCSMAAQGLPPTSVVETQAALPMNTVDPAPMMKLSPFNYVGSSSCEAYNSLAMESATYCTHQEQLQGPPQPANSAIYNPEFEVMISNSNTASIPDISVDVGPPPVHLPCLEAPVTIDTTCNTGDPSYSSPGASFYTGPQSTPHSPMSVGETGHHKIYSFNKTSYSKNRTKTSRGGVMRATSPMFPDQSTPLSRLKRQPSTSSITSSNRSLDQLSTFSVSVKSDPGIYSLQNNNCDSNVNSPSVGQGSPAGFEFSSSNGSTPQSRSGSRMQGSPEGSSRSCLELEMPSKYARRINDLDRKILKLQAERSKVLEKAHQNKSSTGPRADLWHTDVDAWMFPEKLTEVGKAHLYIFPLGIHELDDALYDDANTLLRQVGGFYLDLQTSINILRSMCCKGMFLNAEISTCFAYIKSLLHENQNLKLSNSQGVYSIQLDSEEGLADEVLAVEFSEALAAANNVLRCAQHITISYINVQAQLQKMRQVAASKVDNCSSICQKLGVADRERRSQIRAALEGNCTTMASAERVWPQYYQTATQTIKTITECIHPSTTMM